MSTDDKSAKNEQLGKLPIAHWRAFDKTPQPLNVHLRNVGELSGRLASKLGLYFFNYLLTTISDVWSWSGL